MSSLTHIFHLHSLGHSVSSISEEVGLSPELVTRILSCPVRDLASRGREEGLGGAQQRNTLTLTLTLNPSPSSSSDIEKGEDAEEGEEGDGGEEESGAWLWWE